MVKIKYFFINIYFLIRNKIKTNYILFYSKKRNNLLYKYTNHINYPDSIRYLINKYNKLAIADNNYISHTSTVYYILNAKNSNTIKNEWSDYVNNYNKSISKINKMIRFIFNIENKEKNLDIGIPIIFNQRDYYSKSKLIILGNSFKTSKKEVRNGMDEISIELMSENTSDEIIEFEL